MKPYKVYAEVLEDTALAQFLNAMKQDFVVSGALMPDAHTGYSLPIGAVVATKDMVVPAWVGYDIGCGMCALKLEGIPSEMVRAFKNEIFEAIYEKIPVGFHTNQTSIKYSLDGMTPKGKEIAVTHSQIRLGRKIGQREIVIVGIESYLSLQFMCG